MDQQVTQLALNKACFNFIKINQRVAESFASSSVTSYFAETSFPLPATPNRSWPTVRFITCPDNATFPSWYPQRGGGLCPAVSYRMLDVLDIQSIDDFWDWLPTQFIPNWYENQRGGDVHKFRVADGFRYLL